jgi:PPP family 3-phenylpropionic acid transporter
VSVVGYILVGLSTGAFAILIAYTLTSLCYTPLMPLAETYALKGLAARGRAYGPVRLWGSFAFIFGNFAAGVAADIIPARNLIWLMVTASALVALAVWGLEPLSVNAPEQDAQSAQRPTSLRDPGLVAVFAGASLIQASHALFYGFSALQWHAAGLDGTFIAALWALGVAAEIVLFAVQARLPPVFTPTVMLIPWLQVLHALSFGATHLGTLMFLARNAPAGKAATAQGYFAITAGLVMAAATGISGVLYQDFGSRAYVAMALVAIAGGACGFIAHRTRRNPTG